MLKTLQVYDPPMCCSSGVCGPAPDPVLPRAASDFQWLAQQGVLVQRFNLAQQPREFATNEIVKQFLAEKGVDCLPLIIADGAIVGQGAYPNRDELAALAGLQTVAAPSLYTAAVAELVAIGAAIASNCEPCFKHHFDQARKLGVSTEDMMRAVDTAQAVKETPARSVLELANRFLKRETASGPLTVLEGSSAAGKSGGCCS